MMKWVSVYVGKNDISYNVDNLKHEKSEEKKSWKNKEYLRKTEMVPFTHRKRLKCRGECYKIRLESW